MAPRRPEGAALLVAGFGVPSAPGPDATAVHTLAQIGEALLATGAGWQIRRLSAASGERYAADRATLKQHLDDLAAEPVRVALVVLLGTIVEVSGEPALVTGAQAREYPEDATLPFAWIRQRLLAAQAEQLVAVVSARGEGSPATWLAALATRRAQHVIATDAPEGDHPAVVALHAGLCGRALDRRTGTVTMASLSAYLSHRAPHAVMQASAATETLAQPPPLAGFWDARRSQVAPRPPTPLEPSALEDLTGTVLPGPFRIDGRIATGTFGTVYRAYQAGVDRNVAIKVLHADIDPSSEDGRLFVQEIRSVGKIKHLNVVPIYHAGMTHDGRLFFVMELLEGRDLQQLGGEGPLPPARAVELVRQLLAGLGAAHDASLIHADVKPANALVVPRAAADPEDPAEPGERLVLVDFGLSRLRPALSTEPTESAGGTPAYMAPEQLQEGRIDTRSDLYSAALVLVYLLTGWRRENPHQLAPPLEGIGDPALRAVLERALHKDPARRYPTARALSTALTGKVAAAQTPATVPQPIVPFRHLAPFTEADRGRLHGREADLALLTEHVLFRPGVIYTAPSGTGKTSLLRAGLVPHLEALGIHAVYVRCRGAAIPPIAAAIHPGSASLPEAIEAWRRPRGGKLVLVLDQVESAIGDPGFLPAVLGFDRWPAGADVCVVLSIREDHLARLVGSPYNPEPGTLVQRLPPLRREGARAAIAGPLAECRLAIEPELLEKLLDDLEAAGAKIGPELGWGGAPGVYPPHLQLACSVLYEQLGKEKTTLTVADYDKLGGFKTIVGEYLQRVLDDDLGDSVTVAQDLLLALVTATHERAMRPESELVEVAGKHGPEKITAVLEFLRERGLLVRVRGPSGPAWELVHDSLVPRVQAWIDARALARRHAIELVRYHLRRSQPGAPSLLDRDELRELKAHEGAISELDAEWRPRGDEAGAWTPGRLVARSRQVLRRRALLLGAGVLAVVATGATAAYSSIAQARRAEAEAERATANIGEIQLVIEAFDWDAQGLVARAVPTPTSWRWDLHERFHRFEGRSFAGNLIQRRPSRRIKDARVEDIDVRGVPALLVVHREGCTPSRLPLDLPRYDPQHRRVKIAVRIPTCAASRADMIEIPAGAFISGGPGEPAPSEATVRRMGAPPDEERLELPVFSIDRTEVTNAAFSVLAALGVHTGIQPRDYASIEKAGLPRYPVTSVSWFEARTYCRFLGKDLPTFEQWGKAMRGGLALSDGAPNPMPRRNLPWGAARAPIPAQVNASGAVEVGSHPGDASPYGVLDLAGNITEWTLTPQAPDNAGAHITRGGNWGEVNGEKPEEVLQLLVSFMSIRNPRDNTKQDYARGMRCAVTPVAPAQPPAKGHPAPAKAAANTPPSMQPAPAQPATKAAASPPPIAAPLAAPTPAR